jgi:hypothetical protein
MISPKWAAEVPVPHQAVPEAYAPYDCLSPLIPGLRRIWCRVHLDTTQANYFLNARITNAHHHTSEHILTSVVDTCRCCM